MLRRTLSVALLALALASPAFGAFALRQGTGSTTPGSVSYVSNSFSQWYPAGDCDRFQIHVFSAGGSVADVEIRATSATAAVDGTAVPGYEVGATISNPSLNSSSANPQKFTSPPVPFVSIGVVNYVSGTIHAVMTKWRNGLIVADAKVRDFLGLARNRFLFG